MTIETPEILNGSLSRTGGLKNPFRPRGEHWDKIRQKFCESPERPTFKELSVEFNIPEKTLTNAAFDQGWPILRAQAMNAALEEAGARETILAALQASRAVVSAGENAGLIMLQKIVQLANEVSDDKALATRSNILSTLGFAISNTAKAMKDLGIVGFAGKLKEEGTSGNNQWDPKLLAQVNVTIQNLASAEKPVDVV